MYSFFGSFELLEVKAVILGALMFITKFLVKRYSGEVIWGRGDFPTAFLLFFAAPFINAWNVSDVFMLKL
jgi:hypothetical protein